MIIVWNQATELEIIMREALIENNILFDEQVYKKKKSIGVYIFDFVVYGEFAKIIVECDGPHHYRMDRYYLDSIRDLWSIQNGYQDILRFSKYDIRRNIGECIESIKKSLSELDKSLDGNQERKNIIQEEKEKIKLRKNSHFYEGVRPFNKYVGNKIAIQDLEHLIDNTRNEELVVNMKNTSNEISNNTQDMILEFDLSSTELATYELLKTLPKNQKKLIWFLINNTNKDNICLFDGKKSDLFYLENLELLFINPFYKSYSLEISLFILPNTPRLIKVFKRIKIINNSSIPKNI